MTKTEINWRKYSKRICKSMHHCRICGKTIALGAVYYDGGFDRRAHEVCVGPKEPDMKQRIVEIMKKWEVELCGHTAVFPNSYEVVAKNILKVIESEKKK